MLRKIFKYFRNTLLIILVIISLLLIFIQTGIFKTWLKDQVTDILNNNINGQVSIEKIEGNFFTFFRVINFEVYSNEDKLFQLSDFKISYNPLWLLYGELRIDSITFINPHFRISQLTDSTWNYTNLFPSNDKVEEDTSDSEDLPDIVIRLNDFSVSNASIDIKAIENSDFLPKHIQDLNICLSADYTPEKQYLNLTRLSFLTEEPLFEVSNLEFKLLGELKRNLELQNFVLNTGRNEINLNGNYSVSGEAPSNLNLLTRNFDISEFDFLLGDFGLKRNPDIKISASYFDDIINLDAGVEKGEELINFKGKIESLSDSPVYQIVSEIRNLNIDEWVNNLSASSDLYGSVTIDGRGISPETADILLQANLKNSVILNRPFTGLDLTTNFIMGDVSTTLNLLGNFGEINLEGNVRDITNLQQFDVRVLLKNLNLAPLFLEDSLSSNINLELETNGSKFNFEKLIAYANIKSSNSRIQEILIDSLNTSVSVKNKEILFDTLAVYNEIAGLNASGALAGNELRDVIFRINLKNIIPLKNFIGADSAGITGNIHGRVSGNLDSLKGELDFDLKDILLNTQNISRATGRIKGTMLYDRIFAGLDAQFKDISISDQKINDLSISGKIEDKDIYTSVEIQKDSILNSSIEGFIRLDSLPSIVLSKLNLNINQNLWSNKKGDIRLVLDEDMYSLSNFNLLSEESAFYVDGNLSIEKENDINIIMENLSLGNITPHLFEEPGLDGICNADIKLNGYLNNPTAEINFITSDILLDETFFGDLNVNADIKDSTFVWTISLSDSERFTISSSGNLPVSLGTDNIETFISRDRELSANLIIEDFDLVNAKILSEYFSEMNGILKGEITINQTLSEPEVNILFKVDSANLKSPELGIDYRDINVLLESENDLLILKKMNINGGKGRLTGEGKINLIPFILNDSTKNINLKFRADNFELANSPNYEMTIDGGASIEILDTMKIFNSDMTIQQSSLNIDYLLKNSMGGSSDRNTPLLIEALTKVDTVSVDSIGAIDNLSAPEIEKNIVGNINLFIPRNTWLRHPNFNLEIKGELEIRKQENLTISGQIEIYRGNVLFVGKKFDLIKGLVKFSGDTEINPELLIELEYLYRDFDKEKNYVKVIIKGRADKPDITFTHNDSPISEGDAVSYVLFGRKMEDLTQSQQVGMGKGDKNMLSNTALNMFANALSSSIGRKIGLDFLEVSGEENWTQGSVTAGKYLTPDLFVSYEKGFGTSGTEDIPANLVTLKYEIYKYLFLQLITGSDNSSGMDIIIKFE